MSYHDNRAALVMIAMELQERGWKIFGFKEDQSDMMTDYWCPASWGGIATKNGYVLIVDNHTNSYSGYEVKKYNYNNTTYKASARIEKLVAMMNDPASTENEKASCAVLIEKEKEKQGVAPTYTVTEVYPTFVHGNPKNANWHIELNGQILAKGNGAFAVNNYDWEDETKTAAEQKAEKLAKFIAKIEKVLTDSDALQAEVIKVAKTVTKPVEKADKTINEGDILSFSYHGGYWIVNHVYDRSGKMAVTYEVLGSEKRGYQRTKNGKRYYQYLSRLQKEIEEGKVKVYTMQEVTEYQEKTVFKKTGRKQKVSDSIQLETTEEIPTEQPAQETNTYNNNDTNNQAIISINNDKNGIEIKFNQKPSANIIAALKENGYKWSSFNSVWWTKQTPERLKFASMLVESYNSIIVEEPMTDDVESATEAVEVAEVQEAEQVEEQEQHKFSFDIDTDYTYFDLHFKSWNFSVEDITTLMNITSINYCEYGEKFICTGLTIEQVKQVEMINKDNGAIIFIDKQYNELPHNSEPVEEQEIGHNSTVTDEPSNVIYHDFRVNAQTEQEEETTINLTAFDDILSKFDNIEVTTEQKISADDLEFCQEQENIYRLTINAYNSLNEQLQAVKPIAAAHGQKYSENNNGYIYAKRSAFDTGFSEWDLEKNIVKIKDRFIQCICLWFEQKYNITIDEQKIQKKYDKKVTYENIVDEITIQLNGFNFNEKAEQEIKQKLSNSINKEASPKGNKLTINSFLYIDTSWKQWGTEKIHYNSTPKVEQLLTALLHFENGLTVLSNDLQALNNQLRNGKNDEVFGVHELNFSKVKSIKIFKNGKVEIEFASNQLANKFNKEYCSSNVA